jgi:hypothetical protein
MGKQGLITGAGAGLAVVLALGTLSLIFRTGEPATSTAHARDTVEPAPTAGEPIPAAIESAAETPADPEPVLEESPASR